MNVNEVVSSPNILPRTVIGIDLENIVNVGMDLPVADV